jgi:S-formylglutathione hydrolase FrmB
MLSKIIIPLLLRRIIYHNLHDYKKSGNMVMNMIKSSSRLLFVVILLMVGKLYAGDVTIIDSRHYSNVFGEIRNFRIFLPPGYNENPDKKYPVIYFYHGWSQRYFGSGPDSYNSFEKGNDNGGDNIANFVKDHEVIVVKPDGYNRSPGQEYYLRPYNILPVETFRQFPLYFPELVSFIDANYRTLADRNHRAVSGLSMGGFMSFWIGGKYPQLVSAIGNFCGSEEFVVGPRDFPVEYRHIDMYNNYGGINVRLNFGDEDFIRYYHRDLNNVWTKILDNYEYAVYPAAHSTCGMRDMFGFIMNTFKNPLPVPDKWGHIDVYPEFSVWGYDVSSDREVPGFTILEDADTRGFRCSVREHLPDGELLPFVKVTVKTPPGYDVNTAYIINDYDQRLGRSVSYPLKSDEKGRLTITIDGSRHEIGINKPDDKPNITIAGFSTGRDDIVRNNQNTELRIRLLNKGIREGQTVKARLIPVRNSAEIISGEAEFGTIDSGMMSEAKKPFIFRIPSDSVEIVRFRLEIYDRQGNEWTEFFEVPVFPDNLPEINQFEVADGRVVTVAKEGIHEETIMLGKGNGDGMVDPGESVVLLVRDGDKLWRTYLTCHDKFVNPYGTNVRLSDNWGSYDHVGGSAKYSVPLISSDCPENHIIELIGEYWLPDYPNHIIKKGVIRLKVTGTDRTSPELRWCRVTGDNVIQARIFDGTDVKNVKARLVNKASPDKVLEFDLLDNGLAGDRALSDNVFSFTVPEQKFGLYIIGIAASDSYGNKMEEKAPGYFVLH